MQTADGGAGRHRHTEPVGGRSHDDVSAAGIDDNLNASQFFVLNAVVFHEAFW